MFGKDKKKGPDLAKVQSALASASGAGVRNLSARQSGTVIEIYGEADSLQSKQEAFRKITDQVGDASGVVNRIQTVQGEARPAAASPMASTPGAGGARTHKVVKGETLGHIAQHYYGKASLHTKIFEANRDKVKDPDKIHEGMTLTIPA